MRGSRVVQQRRIILGGLGRAARVVLGSKGVAERALAGTLEGLGVGDNTLGPGVGVVDCPRDVVGGRTAGSHVGGVGVFGFGDDGFIGVVVGFVV